MGRGALLLREEREERCSFPPRSQPRQIGPAAAITYPRDTKAANERDGLSGRAVPPVPAENSVLLDSKEFARFGSLFGSATPHSEPRPCGEKPKANSGFKWSHPYPLPPYFAFNW